MGLNVRKTGREHVAMVGLGHSAMIAGAAGVYAQRQRRQRAVAIAAEVAATGLTEKQIVSRGYAGGLCQTSWCKATDAQYFNSRDNRCYCEDCAREINAEANASVCTRIPAPKQK